MPDESAVPRDLVALLELMRQRVQQFHDLLKEEQQAIRTLSFGQFSDVTEKKTQLLSAIRELEQERRRLEEVGPVVSDQYRREVGQKQRLLIDIIAAADRMNRLNAELIGQSLAFLQGTLSLWQRSPASAPLYSQTGSVVATVPRSVGIKG